MAEAQLRALLEPKRRQSTKFLHTSDEVMIVDFHPHVGDRALATYDVRKGLEGVTCIRHLLVGIGDKTHSKYCQFSCERLQHHAASEWLMGNLKLYKEVTSPLGQVQQEEVKPETEVPEPTEEELRKHPGALEAWRGLSALELKACTVAGSKIKIRPDKLKQFGTAGVTTTQTLAGLTKKHEEHYELAFQTMLGTETGNGKEDHLADGRTPELPSVNRDSRKAVDLVVFESFDGLKAHAPNIVESKSGLKGVKLLKDDLSRTVYAMAYSEDMYLEEGDNLGGIGGGNIVDEDPDRMRAISWALPLGDRTYVQLAKAKAPGSTDDDEDKLKYSAGTFYSVVRELESKSTKPISLTSFGEIKPIAENGLHKYEFGSPPGAENHRSMEFVPSVLKEKAKLSSGNFFCSLVDKTTGLGNGILQFTWRLMYDNVGHTLKPHRVQVTVKERAFLPKGKPVKLAWP